MSSLNILTLFLFKFIYLFLRESKVGIGAEREGERERIPSRHHTVSAEPDVGLKLMNREIMTRAKVRGLTE